MNAIRNFKTILSALSILVLLFGAWGAQAEEVYQVRCWFDRVVIDGIEQETPWECPPGFDSEWDWGKYWDRCLYPAGSAWEEAIDRWFIGFLCIGWKDTIPFPGEEVLMWGVGTSTEFVTPPELPYVCVPEALEAVEGQIIWTRGDQQKCQLMSDISEIWLIDIDTNGTRKVRSFELNGEKIFAWEELAA